jgi:thiol-disulfide isomerase/thioredoxin
MRGTRTVRLIASLAAIGLVVLGGGLAVACGSSSSGSSSASDQSSSDVQFISAGDFDMAAYAGRPLVVNYFGSWCPPCNLEAPALSSWIRSHPDAQFVGVAVEDTEDGVTGFMDEYDLSYPVVLDPDWSTAAENAVNGVPTTIFYDAEGNEVDRIVGAATEAQMDLSYARAAQ